MACRDRWQLQNSDKICHDLSNITVICPQDEALPAEERAAVIRALFAADPTLRGAGWTGSGHQMRGPNDHVYYIGDCGGAVVESRCNECGATIGGTRHSLTAGNRADVLGT